MGNQDHPQFATLALQNATIPLLKAMQDKLAPEAYDLVISAMREFRSSSPAQVDRAVERVVELAHPHKFLVAGLSAILPAGYQLLDHDGSLYLKKPNGVVKHIGGRVSSASLAKRQDGNETVPSTGCSEWFNGMPEFSAGSNPSYDAGLPQ
ncbi:hypothetical protein CC1G_06607 [Coprinopsis cinerea okayama7|uniref:Uncharacterized protein n=1 Tax=Coprinopsis cinerea (strain Okayama-7 / 130 / ATCC MYA-4618 / FGSC 9003) TaxID=240176 RepID=A8N2X2_COPC7|nr:hypothetical protein CC1G_06607 [Coprinopsis cinerea okayama7\|eukprot:XP_001829270.2 hypothetical protein CC1G_06607 [Coprinopsis cinerea okayama7\